MPIFDPGTPEIKGGAGFSSEISATLTLTIKFQKT